MGPPSALNFSEVVILIIFFAAAMGVMFASLLLILRKRQSKLVKFEAMHVHELIKLIISMASFVTVCITLVFLVLQNRVIVAQTRYALQSVESNVFSTVTGQNLGMDDVFIRYPELRPYFHQGRDIKEGDANYERALAAAEYLLDYCDSQTTQLKEIPLFVALRKGELGG